MPDIQVTIHPPPALAVTLSIGQGPAGPPGVPGPSGSGSTTLPAGGAISGHRAVKVNGSGQAVYASAADADDVGRLAGVSINAAAPGDPVTVVEIGTVTEPTWAWDIARPVYLGAGGVLTQTVPAAPAAAFLQIVGRPTTPQTLFVAPREPLRLS